MTIYVVQKNQYEVQDVVSVWDSRELAEAEVTRLEANASGLFDKEYLVEEFVLNKAAP